MGEVIVTIYEFNELHLDSWGEIKRGVCVGGGAPNMQTIYGVKTG